MSQQRPEISRGGENRKKNQLEEFIIGVHSNFNAKCCIYKCMYFFLKKERRPIAHISFSNGSMNYRPREMKGQERGKQMR